MFLKCGGSFLVRKFSKRRSFSSVTLENVSKTVWCHCPSTFSLTLLSLWPHKSLSACVTFSSVAHFSCVKWGRNMCVGVALPILSPPCRTSPEGKCAHSRVKGMKCTGHTIKKSDYICWLLLNCFCQQLSPRNCNLDSILLLLFILIHVLKRAKCCWILSFWTKQTT